MGKSRKYIHEDINNILESKAAFGTSRNAAKKDNTAKDKIFSFNSMKIYKQHCHSFASWCQEEYGRRISIEEAKEHLKEYIEHRVQLGHSPNTVASVRSALAKLYGLKGEEICPVPERLRADIKRSRERYVVSEKTGKLILNPQTKAGHFSEKNNKEIVDFQKAVGLRRSELSSLRGNQLVIDENGKAWIHIRGNQGKGGKERMVKVLNDAPYVIEKMREAGDEKVFGKVPGNMDVHHYRSVYATDYYNSIARPVEELSYKNKISIGGKQVSEIYCCQKDRKGEHFDRKAMLEVSQSLGHNRVSVIAYSYLR